ncbi:MAG: hypothetical protein NC123_16800 [Butyrivibrio sp.]|nr:hypothetical protein [Acetatifactor muris]MCM1561177.1 hypothetical protein [Butyrivibrio sp.]
MDLRPINPYYRRTIRKSAGKRRAAAAGYSYPYTWLTPVTDRTQKDVDRAKALISKGWGDMTDAERAEYNVGLKGCINRKDFERIENNIQILLDVLEIDSESHVGSIPEFPLDEYFEDMKRNLTAIREGYCIHADTPAVPELPYNTWTAYNDIEKILLDVYEVVNAQFHYYTGEVFAGEETGLLL